MKKVPRLTTAYISWVLVVLVATGLAVYTGEYVDLMTQAVELSGEIEPGVQTDRLVAAFIVVSVLFSVISFAVGAFLVWRTNKRRAWAKYLLAVFCAFQIYLSMSTFYEILESYEYEMGILDWVLGVVALLLLLFVGIRPFFGWGKEVPSNA